MKALIQRVSHASVVVDGEPMGDIQHGMLVLLGVAKEDDELVADKLLHKVLNYRIFSDDAGKMNLNVQQVKGELLVVSQFTLMADTDKGLRPGFSSAGAPDHADSLYQYFVKQAKQTYTSEKIKTGSFGADMKVSLLNDGPVTFMLEVSPAVS